MVSSFNFHNLSSLHSNYNIKPPSLCFSSSGILNALHISLNSRKLNLSGSRILAYRVLSGMPVRAERSSIPISFNLFALSILPRKTRFFISFSPTAVLGTLSILQFNFQDIAFCCYCFHNFPAPFLAFRLNAALIKKRCFQNLVLCVTHHQCCVAFNHFQ